MGSGDLISRIYSGFRGVDFRGEEINLVEGNRENIKITTPFDLRLAEILCVE